MSKPTIILSPRILQVSQAIQSGNFAILEKFWEDLKLCGAPLIEESKTDPDSSLVTFIWRSGIENSKIHVLCSLATDGGELENLANTDLWYKTYLTPNDLATGYVFSLMENEEPITAESFVRLVQAGLFQPDPYNPNNLLGKNTAFPQESLLKMPFAPKEPWIAKQEGVPSGRIEKHQIYSQLFTGENAGQDRVFWVYTPPEYSQKSEGYPWLLMLDGGAYLDLGIPTIFDNLIAAKKIPPMLAIFVESYSHGTRHIESSCNPLFARFLAEELAPWFGSNYQISKSPKKVIIGGDSYTGLSATFVAFQYPQIFGNVLSQSAPFFWFQGMDREPTPGEDLDPDWLIRQFEKADQISLRFHLDAGRLETDIDPNNKAQTSILESNRHMRDVLMSKHCQIDYIETDGGHDFAQWRQYLPEAIMFLINSASQ